MPPLTSDELIAVIEATGRSGELEEVEREMITGVVLLGDSEVKEILIPRIDMIALESPIDLKEALKTIRESGHSRIPVYHDSIDNVIGILYVKDLITQQALNHNVEVERLLRDPYFVPETKKLNFLLKEFLDKRVHLAIVVDEYGGTAGLVTLEDILEEIVGEIQDEFDQEDKILEKLADGEFIADARININELGEEFDVQFPQDESYDTLGGMLYEQHGKVPEVGDEVVFQNIEFRIMSIEGNRIRNVHIKILPHDEENSDRGDDN
jgi:CBS domain containing-hemolysin-like protein